MIIIPKPIFYKSILIKEEHHFAENIAQNIKLTIEQASVDKFATIITDNVSNMKAVWRILKTKYPNKVFLSCWVNDINLQIKVILKIDQANSIQFQLEKYGHIITLVLTIDT